MGYLSLIFLEAKFGPPARISEANFGAKPPNLQIWKYPPGRFGFKMRLLGKFGVLKRMLETKGAVGSKVGPLWKIDVLKGFWGKKRGVWVENGVYREN